MATSPTNKANLSMQFAESDPFQPRKSGLGRLSQKLTKSSNPFDDLRYFDADNKLSAEEWLQSLLTPTSPAKEEKPAVQESVLSDPEYAELSDIEEEPSKSSEDDDLGDGTELLKGSKRVQARSSNLQRLSSLSKMVPIPKVLSPRSSWLRMEHSGDKDAFEEKAEEEVFHTGISVNDEPRTLKKRLSSLIRLNKSYSSSSAE